MNQSAYSRATAGIQNEDERAPDASTAPPRLHARQGAPVSQLLGRFSDIGNLGRV
jgi:hypothetical protein